MKGSLQKNILSAFLTVSFLPTLLLFTFFGVSTWYLLSQHQEADLKNEAELLRIVSYYYFKNGHKQRQLLKNIVDKMGLRWGKRIILIDSNNRIIIDSEAQSSENEANDPGIAYLSGLRDLFVRKDNSQNYNKIITIKKSWQNYIKAVPILDEKQHYLGAVIFLYHNHKSGIPFVLKNLFIFWGILLAILLIIGCIYSLYFSHRLVKPLKFLKEGAQQVARGNLTVKVPISSDDEIGLVARAFNQMTQKLDLSYRKISELFNYLKTILETVGSIVIVTDEDGIIRLANKRTCELLGYEIDELIDHPIEKLGSDLSNHINALKRSNNNFSSGQQSIIRHAEIHTKGGEAIPCIFAMNVTQHEDRLLFILSAQDLRPVLTLQQQLSDERNRLLVTLRSIGDGVIVTDLEGKITLMNKVAEELTGWQECDAKGMFLSDVFRISDKNGLPIEFPIKQVLKSQKRVDFGSDIFLISRNGQKRSIVQNCTPILDEAHSVIGAVLVFHDFTAEKKLQHEIMKVEKLKSIGVLAGGIAHDFNNILSSILGSIELSAIMVGPDHKAYNYLKLAEKATRRAAGLTQQLLTFSKGGDPIKRLSSLKDIIIDSTRFVLTGTNIDAKFSIPDKLWPVEIDEGQISQVIQNIVLNARQAMPKGGVIRISCRNVPAEKASTIPWLSHGEHVEIKIADEGPGIPKEQLDNIFEPFYTTKETGSGLGLSICHSIIRKHGGHILVESTLGQGTEFTIYLPAKPNDDVPKVSSAHTQPISGKGRVLIMDDEALIRETTCELLKGLGYEVDTVEDGEKALEYFKKRLRSGSPYFAALLDLTVPGGLGGAEIARELLKTDPNANLIVISGYANDPVMASFQKYGFKGCLKKPFTLKELSEVLSRLWH